MVAQQGRGAVVRVGELAVSLVDHDDPMALLEQRLDRVQRLGAARRVVGRAHDSDLGTASRRHLDRMVQIDEQVSVALQLDDLGPGDPGDE